MNYVYVIPYVENENEKFLKTIIPSRKMGKNNKINKNQFWVITVLILP